MSHLSKKPLAIVLGAAFALTGLAAQASVFQTSALDSGYMVAADASKAGEAKCGEKKAGEAKCGEKKANANKPADQNAASPKPDEKMKGKEGKCGEGKCGEKKAK